MSHLKFLVKLEEIFNDMISKIEDVYDRDCETDDCIEEQDADIWNIYIKSRDKLEELNEAYNCR